MNTTKTPHTTLVTARAKDAVWAAAAAATDAYNAYLAAVTNLEAAQAEHRAARRAMLDTSAQFEDVRDVLLP